MFAPSPNGATRWASSSPAGLLSVDSRGSRKAASAWARAERAASAAQLAAGAAVLLLSSRYLFAFASATGAALGGLALAAGAAGYLGAARGSGALVNAQLLGSLVVVMLAFNFVGEVVRDTQVDCALAELYQRGVATQQAVDDGAKSQALAALAARLGELEDSLATAPAGAAGAAFELARDRAALRSSDAAHVRAQVGALRAHAQAVLDGVLAGDAGAPEALARMPETQKSLLRRRVDAADAALDRLNKHDNGAELSVAEFSELLNILSDASIVGDAAAAAPELAAARAALPATRAAIERKATNAYATAMVGEGAQKLQRAAAQRAQRRAAWAAQFASHLAKSQSKGGDYVADLPEHCVKETKVERLVVGTAALVALVSVASAYVALSLSLKMPSKGD